ncbi:MAG: ABC transporter ATP-binding protein [Bacteroidales bacterium]|nr:ABC transporter ATP-binding protein [Bacteroidales bacterium]
MPKNPIIQIEHLSKSFGDKQVLSDINLYVRKGEFITLLGPSGCGKTTLLRMLGGFTAPDSGRILLEGKDISDVPPYRRPLNTVFQRYALFPHLDVYDNVAFGLKLQKVPEADIEKRVKKVLKLVSMSDYEDRDVNSLSGGQQQRVAIARALINQPRVLLLDEPLAALDLKMRKDMQIELKEMHRKLGITFIYVTHDQEEALTLSDTIVVMNEGKIQQIGTPIDIYNEPVNAFVADFIGDSNILNGKMFRDRRVAFIKHEFDCVDEGFGENVSVDVVVRPEDIYFTNDPAKCQFTAKVNSCTFKGVHYEMWVDTDTGYELMIQDYDPYPVGSEVMLYIDPDDIQVMKKERRFNAFPARVTGEGRVMFLDTEFECNTEGFAVDEAVTATVRFEKVDLLDHEEEADLTGNVVFILYKGDHYHLTVKTETGENIWVDTNDIWDKGDFVGIKILPADIKLVKAESGDE